MTESKKNLVVKQDEHTVAEVQFYLSKPKDGSTGQQMISFKYISYQKVLGINLPLETFKRDHNLMGATEEDIKVAFSGKPLHLSSVIIL